MIVYGASVSYYTGKLEAYLRYKGISYERASPYPQEERIKREAGCIQHPVVERDDGRWMSDTTPIILQLEQEHPGHTVLPENPVVRFIALLIEDYADEWLWRAAMHYRWSYEHDRALLSRILTDELDVFPILPRFVKLRVIARRQRTGFVINDGVNDSTWEHVEQGYHRILALMSMALAERPFILGESPSIADFGLMGPMLRHFGQDPTPAEIMRDTAPRVYDWLGRVWNAGDILQRHAFATEVPDDLDALLKEICETHLVQLAENARAYHEGKKKFDMVVQGCQCRDLPVSRYRVWCLEQLRKHFVALAPESRQLVQDKLSFPTADLLWQDTIKADSGYDDAGEAPFNKAINVFENGVPA
jgi:glutathione S-transferase